MNQWLLSMITRWKPDIVVLEDIQQQQNVQIFKTLAWLQGVLIHTLFISKTPYSVVHCATWRKSCGIKGRSRSDFKKAAQLLVKSWYDVSVTQDEADAICIGHHAITKELKNQEFHGWDI